MEEYKLVGIEDNLIYFTHVIKSNSYNFEVSRQLFDSLESFNISNDKDKIVIIFEISILQKFVNVLVLKREDNDTVIETSGKNKINEYDGLLKRFLMKGVCQLTITFNLVNPVANSGTLNVNRTLGNLTGERSFVRKYRLQADNIVLGTIPDKTKVREPTIKFSNS
jgi:hypothetical protein